MNDAVVRAAGGVVTRAGEHGPEVAVVHRPKYDDWSLPKGKRDPGETDEQTAVREVEEEAGLRCSLGRELMPTSYHDRHGRPKVVRYWEMHVVGSRPFEPNHEIDQLAWLPFDEAVLKLTYPHDRDVLANVRLPFTSGSPDSC